MQGYLGEQPTRGEWASAKWDGAAKRQHCGAVAPSGCWISQWKVGWGAHGIPNFIQGVLNNGSTLPALSWVEWNERDQLSEDTTVGEVGGSFSAVHGRWVGALWQHPVCSTLLVQ
jgi:hypothetical protein